RRDGLLTRGDLRVLIRRVLPTTATVGRILSAVAEGAVPLVGVGLGVTLGLPGISVLAVPLIRVSRRVGLLVALLLVALVSVSLVALVPVSGSGVPRGALRPLAART